MPRTYNLGRRATPKADTRARIVNAALVIYRDRGLCRSVEPRDRPRSRRCARHGSQSLPGARSTCQWRSSRRCIVELRIPTPAIFDGLDNLRDRVERLARELAAFDERSEPWWRAYGAGAGADQRMERWRRPEVLHGHGTPRTRAALGELPALDERSVAVVASVIGPPAFFALRARGLTSDEAVLLSLDGPALPWLERRRDRSLARRPPKPPDTRTIAAMTRVALS